MYVISKSARKKALKEMLRVLKKEGSLVLIEPNKGGVDLMGLWGFIPYLYRRFTKRVKVETYGTAFYPEEIERLVRTSGGVVRHKRTYPFFSMMLLPLIAVGTLIPYVAASMIPVVRMFDRILPIRAPSYFITWIIGRRG